MKNKYFDSYDDYVRLQVSKVGCVSRSSKKVIEALEREYYQGTRVGKPRWAESLAKLVEPTRDINVLVLGGRWGSDVVFLREAGYSSIMAVDLYDPPLSNLVQTGDAHYLSKIVDTKISVIWAHHVFEHFFKPSKVMEELNKVVSEKAYMYVGVPFAVRDKYDAQDEFSTPEEFESLMRRFSFYPVEFKESRRGKHKNKIYHFYIFHREVK